MAKMDVQKEKHTLQHLKQVLWPKAYSTNDTMLLDSILHEKFQMIDADGNYTDKQFELNWIKSNVVKHDSFYYEIKRLEIFGNGTAVVAGTGHIFNNDAYSVYQSSNILVKENDLWKAISSHISGVKQISAD
ncbi:MAG: nuclear transport factor 2 family protein [Saprospiraceae bacterium]|nr:nuclear transport factor 2 family protein [Saprospiraceae bacterium]